MSCRLGNRSDPGRRGKVREGGGGGGGEGGGLLTMYHEKLS